MIGALLEIFSLALTTSEESRDLLEIPDDRYQVRATAIARQVPTDRWHEWFPDPTVVDAVLDRIHHAYQFPFTGSRCPDLANRVRFRYNRTNEYGNVKVVRIYWNSWSSWSEYALS